MVLQVIIYTTQTVTFAVLHLSNLSWSYLLTNMHSNYLSYTNVRFGHFLQ